MLAAMIYAVVGVGIIVASTTPIVEPTPSPTGSADLSTPRPAEATISPSLVTLVRETNVRILALGAELEALLALDPFVTGDVISKVKEISAAATFGKGIVDRIGIQPGGDAIAPPLRDAYTRIVAAADTALSVPFADRVAVRRGAEAVVASLVGLPDIDALLAAVEGTPAPTSPASTASPSTAPTPSPTPTPTATPSPSPTPTPTPTATPTEGASGSPLPSALPSGPNQLENGGFEGGLEPWTLVLAPGAAGTLERTTAQPFAGKGSALVTITNGAGTPSALSVEQGGLTLENGRTYVVSLAVRSTADREVRIRLTTGLGEVIASRVVSVTASWATQSFTVTPIGQFRDVRLQVEVGASGQRIWLDDVALG
jgi:carbohydrate binding protein with CBM4/9 domain